MDEVNAHIRQQSSISSDSIADETTRIDLFHGVEKKICLVGEVAEERLVRDAAQHFGVSVVTSNNGLEYAKQKSSSTVFVVDNFEDNPVYNALFSCRHSILGPTALIQLSLKDQTLPDNTRPLYNLAMSGVVVCFTGFRNKDNLTRLVPLVHHMGGSIRKEMSTRVTHLIANLSGGDKYQYASTFRVPVVHQSWVFDSWEHRRDVDFSSTQDGFVAKHKLKPFYGAKVCFLGFPEAELKDMTKALEGNGGSVTVLNDPNCTHVVMEQTDAYMLDTPSALSPKIDDIIVTSPSINNTFSLMCISPSHNNDDLMQIQLKCTPKTPSNRVTRNSLLLETLHEKSHDNCIEQTKTDNEMMETTFTDLNKTNSSTKRKRLSTASPSKSSYIKRSKCDASYSENVRKKISSIVRTPIDYLSNRRRTINGPAQNQNLNASVKSTSGLFNINVIEDLTFCGKTPCTPNATTRKSLRKNKIKKNLFTRTFSSTKFNRSYKKSSKANLDDSTFSEVDGKDEVHNASCFPDFSSCPTPSNEFRLHRGKRVDTAGSSLTNNRVVDEVTELPDYLTSKTHIVKAEWFWTSVQKETCLDEKEYLFTELPEQVLSPSTRRESHQATPSSASRRKRKRLQDTLSSLALQPSPSIHKRRSSVSDAGLLSVSGSFLDCTASPDKTLGELPEVSPIVIETSRKGLTARQQVFFELVQTESNYVNILQTVVIMFKKHLEDMPEEEALLNNTELKIIFGNLPLIYETHVRMLDELRFTYANWSEDRSIGNIILKYSTDLLKAYPPYINFFEEMKEMLNTCDANKPRFHAFLKACQTRPECGRQTLQDLLIRPVQRLPSISLLLNDMLKNTSKLLIDHGALSQALAALKEVMTHINEDKRRTEGQRVMFDIFNEIDNCPPDLVSSHRSFVTRTEVVQLSSSEGLSSKGNFLVLFLFTDQLEVCKKRSKAFNSLKSPNTVNGFHHPRSTTKPYKHIKLIPLSSIKRVIDIKETEECQKVFSLVIRNNDEIKERLYSFAMTEEDIDKTIFLRALCKQMATNACTADSDKFLAYLEPHELDIDTSDISNGTFSKAFKFANRTRLKVGRAFSFNKTPSKLKRAVSSMMSPFGSTTNITPASQLAQMRLASYSNLNELSDANNGDEHLPAAPMSVQPTRKMKSSSLSTAALKRL